MKRNKNKEPLSAIRTVIVCGSKVTQWMKQEIEYAIQLQKEIVVSTPEIFNEVLKLVQESGVKEFSVKLNPEYSRLVSGLNIEKESVSFLSAGTGGT